jgi:hypothetical protein
MNISAISSLLSGWAQPHRMAGADAAGLGSADRSGSVPEPAGSAEISALARFLSRLQQLQESNPDQFKAAVSEVASGLEKAAQAAQSGGDAARAGHLGQLATEFRSAAQSGRLPTVQDLRQAGF